MQPDERSEQSNSSEGSDPADTGRASSPARTREEEADETRSGRPMPEEDAADRTVHHKSGYGGEHGKPRERSGTAESSSGPEEAEDDSEQET